MNDPQGPTPTLPMLRPPDPEKVRAEREYLLSLAGLPWRRRFLGHLKLMGPGFLQSALTLGAGTAAASLFAGAAFGYKLLWVQPVAMLLAVIVFAALAWQTLSTGMRPFEAMRRHAGPFFAYGWAVGSVISSVVWHFAQYAVGSSVLRDMLLTLGLDVPRMVCGLFMLAWAVPTSFLYPGSSRFVLLYERILKWMVWLIIAAFVVVVAKTGIPEPRSLIEGLLIPIIPGDSAGVSGLTVTVAALAAAAGINMVFLYPYSLLSRGWGREHRELAMTDLAVGMWFPFVVSTGLLIIAAASVFHFGDEPFSGTRLGAAEAARILAGPERLGPVVGLWVFGLGILSMALSSISLHLVCSGFACSEMFNWPVGGWKYRGAMLLPCAGVLGSVLWNEISFYVALPTSIVCGALLPIAYVGVLILQCRRGYLGEDKVRGLRGALWIAGIALATLVVVVALAAQVVQERAKIASWFGGGP